MKKSRLSIILLSMVAALAAGAILIGAISYFALAANTEPTPAQERGLAAPTNPAATNKQLPAILESNDIQVIEGEEHEAHESEEFEREEHEFGQHESEEHETGEHEFGEHDDD